MDVQANDDVQCIGDCVDVVGGDSDVMGSGDNDVISSNEISPSYENGAFPKDRYHVEGKPKGISVLEARTSFLKQQLKGSKGMSNIITFLP